jgi:hypothetical protein
MLTRSLLVHVGKLQAQTACDLADNGHKPPASDIRKTVKGLSAFESSGW